MNAGLLEPLLHPQPAPVPPMSALARLDYAAAVLSAVSLLITLALTFAALE